jgi:FHA domain
MAPLTWRCPRCHRSSDREGTCPRCRLLYVPDEPEPQPPAPDGVADDACPATDAVPPGERLALRMPWKQQINLPDAGELILGRSSAQFHAHPEATAAIQVSRRHARFFRDEHGDLYVEDLNSANGTYIDGLPVEGRPSCLRSGQVLRLAMDVDCDVLRLNEHGEPEEG